MEQIPDKKMIGRALQRVRKDAGFKSAESFAAKLGMKTSAYTEYEQGRRAFSYEQAWQMADALQCSMDELGGREWPPGGTPSLTDDERGLVDSYRNMDLEQKGKYRDMAGTFVMASEKDGPGDRADVVGAGHGRAVR